MTCRNSVDFQGSIIERRTFWNATYDLGGCMAIDVYLQLDGIKGDSLDERHRDWIECTSAVWSVVQPKSATASSAGGHTAERCEHGDLVISKLADISSPVLLQTCSSGKTLARAKIEFLRADSNGDRIKYFEIELENVLIGAVVPSIRAGNILTEHMSLKYAKVKWKYIQQKISGGIAGNTSGGWDLSTNRMC